MANFMYEHTDLNIYNQMSRDDKMMLSIKSPLYPKDLTISSDAKATSTMLMQDSHLTNYNSQNLKPFNHQDLKRVSYNQYNMNV